jgi:hypothetical protein
MALMVEIKKKSSLASAIGENKHRRPTPTRIPKCLCTQVIGLGHEVRVNCTGLISSSQTGEEEYALQIVAHEYKKEI